MFEEKPSLNKNLETFTPPQSPKPPPVHEVAEDSSEEESQTDEDNDKNPLLNH